MIIDDRTALVTRAHRSIGQDEPYVGPLGAPVRPRGRAAATLAALAMTFGIAGAAWVVAVWQMSGMDMGVATRLGSFAFFLALWVSMMAAMMLPGAAPAVLRRAHASGHVRVVPLFIGSYLAVWTPWASPCLRCTGRTGRSPPVRLPSRRVSTSSRLSSSTSAGAAARASALDSSSGSAAPARASD